jgi:pantoate--beta-alanine ligase
MTTIAGIAELRAALRPHRPRARIGLVPTMGALHRGHAALFEAARPGCDVVVATIFVNPAQFDDPADLAAYPRTEAQDAALAAAAGVDVLFMPAAAAIYPQGHATRVHVEGAARGGEGEARPGHFAGVATICLKLFNIVQPAAAYFGQKDAQQVAVIRQVVRDLDVDVEVVVVPTVRDADGLALSSRNVRLSADERRRSLAIPRALEAGIAAHAARRDPATAARDVLDQPGIVVEYAQVAEFDEDPTLVVAVRVGSTRLIDNVPLTDPGRAGLGQGAGRSALGPRE